MLRASRHCQVAGSKPGGFSDSCADRREIAQDDFGLGYCNITKCCTEVCPGNIKITDNALIPMKERVVGRKYDPLVWLGSKITRRPLHDTPAVPGKKRKAAPGSSFARQGRGQARSPSPVEPGTALSRWNDRNSPATRSTNDLVPAMLSTRIRPESKLITRQGHRTTDCDLPISNDLTDDHGIVRFRKLFRYTIYSGITVRPLVITSAASQIEKATEIPAMIMPDRPAWFAGVRPPTPTSRKTHAAASPNTSVALVR
jgi:hypothetical protein